MESSPCEEGDFDDLCLGNFTCFALGNVIIFAYGL